MARAPFQVLVYPYRPLDNHSFEYALLKRADQGFWQGVAGGGEDSETPREAAQREAREEAGIPETATFLRLDTICPNPVTAFRDSYLWGDQVYVIPQYFFGVLVEVEQISLSHEHTAFQWLSYAEAYPLLKYDGDKLALWELDRKLRGLGPRD